MPPGIRDAVLAETVEGLKTKGEIARNYGVNVTTVDRVARAVRAINPDHLAEIRRGLPSLLAVLAGNHATKALEKIDDPNASVRHTFGAKLAVEANRVAQPGAEAPGHTMLTFINQLNVNRAPIEVVEAPPAVDAEFEQLALPEVT